MIILILLSTGTATTTNTNKSNNNNNSNNNNHIIIMIIRKHNDKCRQSGLNSIGALDLSSWVDTTRSITVCLNLTLAVKLTWLLSL